MNLRVCLSNNQKVVIARELLKQQKKLTLTSKVLNLSLVFTKETSQYTVMLGYENSQVAMYKTRAAIEPHCESWAVDPWRSSGDL